MTSAATAAVAPRSRSRRWLGGGLLAVAWGTALAGAAGAAGDPFVQDAKGVTIDWRHGKLVARGAAAADWRMPSADIARAGAERRARAAGRVRLGEALRTLPLGSGRRLEAAAVERAVGRARTVGIEYQSNGGVELQLEVSFGDWREPAAPAPPTTALTASAGTTTNEPAPPALSFRLPEGTLAAAPLVLVHGHEASLGTVRYAAASELADSARSIAVRADKKGRLVVDGDVAGGDLAQREAVIYVQKVLR